MKRVAALAVAAVSLGMASLVALVAVERDSQLAPPGETYVRMEASK